MSHWPARALTPLLETTVGGVLRAAAWRAPSRVALIDPSRREWTYGELRDEADGARGGILTRFSPGEPVAVWAGNGADWVLLEFGRRAGRAEVGHGQTRRNQARELGAPCSGTPSARGVFLRSDVQGRDPGAGGANRLAAACGRCSRWAQWPADDGSPLPEVDAASPAQILYTLGHHGPAPRRRC